MSTILRALRRVEGDRIPLMERPLREQVAASESRRGFQAVLPVVAGGLAATLLLGGAAVFLLWPGATEEAHQAGPPVVAPPAVVAAADGIDRPRPGAPPPATAGSSIARAPRRAVPTPPRDGETGLESGKALPATSPAPPARDLPAAALISEVTTVARRPRSPLMDLAAESPPSPAELPPGALRPKGYARQIQLSASRDGSLPAADPPALPRTAAVTPRREPSPPQAAPIERTAAPEAAPVARAPAKKVTEVPAPQPAEPTGPVEAATQAPLTPTPVVPALPEVVVQRTVWHPVAERRVAVVKVPGGEEPRELREGDAVGPLTVKRIEPSGVVFVHAGGELRRRVGER